MKKRKLKYKDIKSGDIFKVPFDPPFFSYAQRMTNAAMAFYDLKITEEIIDLQKIVESPVIFILLGGADGIL